LVVYALGWWGSIACGGSREKGSGDADGARCDAAEEGGLLGGIQRWPQVVVCGVSRPMLGSAIMGWRKAGEPSRVVRPRDRERLGIRPACSEYGSSKCGKPTRVVQSRDREGLGTRPACSGYGSGESGKPTRVVQSRDRERVGTRPVCSGYGSGECGNPTRLVQSRDREGLGTRATFSNHGTGAKGWTGTYGRTAVRVEVHSTVE
jgi:hypothetical protein